MKQQVVTLSREIERMTLNYDSDGYVMPPELFTVKGAKNYFARIASRDPKYKWNRQWVQKYFPTPMGGPKYSKAGFQIGEVYDFHASYQPKTDGELEEKKRAAGKHNQWKVDKTYRVNSQYNGFWECVGIDTDGIKMRRLHPGDMDMKFPKNDATSDDRQSSLNEFFGGVTGGDEHIL